MQKGPVLRPSEILLRSRENYPSIPHPTMADNKLVTLTELEKAHIKIALENLRGNFTQTARTLGISLSTLKRKLKVYGLRLLVWQSFIDDSLLALLGV